MCSRANSEWGLSLLASLCIRRRVPLITRLDWRGGLFLDSAFPLFWVVNNGRVESYLKITHHLPVDHYGQVERALCPYLSGLGVHVGQLLLGFRPCWSPSGSISVRSPTVSSLHAHVIRPSVWLAPLASPPFPDAIVEIEIRWVGSLGC